MKTEYKIKVNGFRDEKICEEYIARFIVLPAPPYERDKRATLRVEVSNNPLDALSGTKELMKAICQFINKVAPHYGARVV